MDKQHSSMTEAQANKALALQFIEAIKRGDSVAIKSTYHEEGICWISGNTLISGQLNRDQVAVACEQIFAVFPDGMDIEVTNIIAEGEWVAIEAVSDGKHISGRHYSNHYHFLAQFKNRKLLKWKEYMDTELVTDILCGGQRPEVGDSDDQRGHADSVADNQQH